MEPTRTPVSEPVSSLERAAISSTLQDLREHTLKERLGDKLRSASNVLLFGVGGGNDSISALMVKLQLEKDFGLTPARVTVAAMLPDVLQYRGLAATSHPLASEITASSERWVGGRQISAFPEPLLAEHKDRFGIAKVVGLSMEKGSEGVFAALSELVRSEGFDLVIACDVGGDFIATPSNSEVLSPMMDGYALHALRRFVSEQTDADLVCCVFGLGADGESTPEMLRDALALVGSYEPGSFDLHTVEDVEKFYRSVIQLNRHSRTADHTFRSLHGDPSLDQPIPFKARFHTQPSPGDSKVYYGEFEHRMDKEFAGKYYLFDELAGIANPFEVKCENGIEWFLKIQKAVERPNHELNGQSYADLATTLGLQNGSLQSLYFGTPSRKFSPQQRQEIAADTLSSIQSAVFDCALVFSEDLPPAMPDTLARTELPGGKLSLIARRSAQLPLNKFIEYSA